MDGGKTRWFQRDSEVAPFSHPYCHLPATLTATAIGRQGDYYVAKVNAKMQRYRVFTYLHIYKDTYKADYHLLVLMLKN
jgi:hypothetical protein